MSRSDHCAGALSATASNNARMRRQRSVFMTRLAVVWLNPRERHDNA